VLHLIHTKTAKINNETTNNDKQLLLDGVLMISGIINVEVSVNICQDIDNNYGFLQQQMNENDSTAVTYR